jgi:hypothetical protein
LSKVERDGGRGERGRSRNGEGLEEDEDVEESPGRWWSRLVVRAEGTRIINSLSPEC